MKRVILFFCLFLSLNLLGQGFKNQQMQWSRVENTMFEKDAILRSQFEQRAMSYPPHNIYIRAFKEERILEVWVQNAPNAQYQKFRDYIFCKDSGYLGPKRKQGDEQIPEGFYWINRFNPQSNFYLSLGLNYPNPSDVKVSPHDNLGGSIYIHGACETTGCIPITDNFIKELYWLCVLSTNKGQEYIPVHVFPYKFGRTQPFLYEDQKTDRKLKAFWNNLQEGYDFFNNNRRPPMVHIEPDGRYLFF